MHTAVGLECTRTQYTFIFEEVQILKFAELSDSTSLMERLSRLFFFKKKKEALSLKRNTKQGWEVAQESCTGSKLITCPLVQKLWVVGESHRRGTAEHKDSGSKVPRDTGGI